MKIYAIVENNKKETSIGYLFYYEKSKEFYIELLDGLEEWDVPLLLSTLYRKGERTINSYWSKVWVQQRIVPSDRQNIGQILRDNKLNMYDEYLLLMLAKGRCEQDDFYLIPTTVDALPSQIIKRFNYRVENVMTLNNFSLLVTFRNGKVKKCNLNKYFIINKGFRIVYKNSQIFNYVRIVEGGYGVCWDEFLSISNMELYDMGKDVSITSDNLNKFVAENVLTTYEVMNLLNCSRQYVNELVKNQKLHPIKSYERITLFLKSEVEKLNWV
ncbi:MAG: DUF2442 domain-containing protein [Clostridia bacterium]|nr:DUF2442 domain-containing protein [Clostridia bacterium]